MGNSTIALLVFSVCFETLLRFKLAECFRVTVEKSFSGKIWGKVKIIIYKMRQGNISSSQNTKRVGSETPTLLPSKLTELTFTSLLCAVVAAAGS